MTIKIIKYYIILLVIFFSWTSFANVGLEITEIMYAPENGAGYDWVEIYNNGSDTIDMTDYRFFRGSNSENGTSGPLTNRIGSSILKPNEYAILASNMSNYSWLDFSGSIFSISSSIISLPSSGVNTYIAMLNPDKNIINDVTYDTSKGGSKASKTSLSKIGEEWTSANPTPGMANSSNSNYSNDSYEDESLEEDIPVVENPEILKITTKIISPKIITAGIPFSLNSLTTTNRGETYAVGKFIWNFGDGMVREVGQSSPFNYTYEYPGEYALTLSYYDSIFSKTADSTDRITVKVVPSSINISSVGTTSDPFVEIENKSNYEIILSNWIITAGTHFFIIPEGTTLLPNKKIKLSPKITSFVGEDIKSVIIMNPNKEVIATYPTQTKKSITKISSVNNTTYNNPVSSNNNLQDISSLTEDSQVINLNDLGASAIGSGSDISNSSFAWAGLFIVIGLGVSSFLLIKKKKDVEDYVEKGIRAEDMTIIE